jgi:type I restriction enzyme S subunit
VSARELSTDAPYALAIGPFGSNLKVSDYRDSGVPLVFVRNIRTEEFGGASTKFVSHRKAVELRAHRVHAGDLLVTKMGDPPGDCAIYPSRAPAAIITSDCIRFAVDSALARPDYVAALFLTAGVKRQIGERTKGVAQKKINLKTFKTIQFPLPDLQRQEAIVARLNDIREAQHALDQTLQTMEAQGSRLQRSVLRAAFHGRL